MPFSIKGTIGLDGSGLDAGFKRAESSAAAFSKRLNDGVKGFAKNQFVQAFGVAALAAQTKKVIDYGGAINDTSARLGVGTEALQKWNFAASQNGTSLDTVAGFFDRLAVARASALAGNEAAIKSFKQLDVTLGDLKSKRLEDIALQIGKVIEAGDPQQLISALRDVGGRGAGDLVAMMKDGLEASFESAQKLGLILEDAVISRLDDMGDSLDILAAKMRGPVADALVGAANWASKFVDAIGAGAAYLGALSVSQAYGTGEAGRAFDAAVAESMEKEEQAKEAGRKRRERSTFKETLLPEEKKEEKKKAKSEAVSPFQFDSLSRVGGFSQGQDSALASIAKKQLTALEKIEENTKGQVTDGL